MRAIDLTGQRFGRLTVIRMVGRKRVALWECRCDCGNITNVWQSTLSQGRTVSCGCYHRERVTKYGESRTRLYSIWYNMLRRCENPKDYHYGDYGGRGIKVCAEWHDFMAFKEWAMANGYRDDLTIERNDVNGNYEPSNCSWIPLKEQPKNRRSTVYLSYQGKQYTLSDLARQAGMSRQTLHNRLKSGWSVEDAVETQVDKGNGRLKKKSCPSVCETEGQQRKNICWRYSNAEGGICQ